jgi:hypothetical protein
MGNELSNKQIIDKYYEVKSKMVRDIHTIAVLYFTHASQPYGRIEKPLGSLMSWANGELESKEERDTMSMYVHTLLKWDMFRGLLKELVAFNFLTKEQYKEFIRQSPRPR